MSAHGDGCRPAPASWPSVRRRAGGDPPPARPQWDRGTTPAGSAECPGPGVVPPPEGRDRRTMPDRSADAQAPVSSLRPIRREELDHLVQRRPRRRFLREHRQHQVHQPRRSGRGRRPVEQDAREPVALLLAVPHGHRRPAGERGVEDRAEAVDVGPLVHRAVRAHGLGCGVRRRGLAGVAVVAQHGRLEVGQHRNRAVAEQDALGREVAVPHARVVGVQERPPDDQPDRGDLVRVQPAARRDPVGQRPLAELGDEVGPRVGQDVGGVHGEDPGMGELPERACLRPELLGGAALGEADVEHRDGDPAVGVLLPGPVDVGVPAPAQRGELPEPGQLRGLRSHARRVASQVINPSSGCPGTAPSSGAGVGPAAAGRRRRHSPRRCWTISASGRPAAAAACQRAARVGAAPAVTPRAALSHPLSDRRTCRAGCDGPPACATPQNVCVRRGRTPGADVRRER